MGVPKSTIEPNTLQTTEDHLDKLDMVKGKFAAKIFFTTASWMILLLGMIITFALFFHPELGGVIGKIHNFLTTCLSAFLEGRPIYVLTLLKSLFINVFEFIFSIITAILVSRAVSRNTEKKGSFSSYGRFCIMVSRQTISAGLLFIVSGITIICSGIFILVYYNGFDTLTCQFHLIIEFGTGAVFLGLGILVTLPMILSEPKKLPPKDLPSKPEKESARANGKELLELLRKSPIFRRQICCDIELNSFPFIRDNEDALKELVEKYPRINSILPYTGIQILSSSQSRSLKEILKDRGSKSMATDHAFIGWPGSGRTTLANLLAVSAVLHRKGSIYFSTAESAFHNLDRDTNQTITARHPATQMRKWLKAAGMVENVQIEEAYAMDSIANELHFESQPDIIFSDVNILSRDLLSRQKGYSKNFIGRLKYVIIDHPDRLSREDLIRLRISIARLRMTAEMMGCNPTFIVLLPRLNNHQELSKFLVNNSNVYFHEFATWPGKSQLVTWLPPLELLDFKSKEPVIVRASFIDEVVELLTELGYHSNKLPNPLRIAIIDSIPLLGPEARSHVRERIRIQLGRESDGQDAKTIMNTWHYFSTVDIAIDKSYQFDVVVSLGIGNHPEHLVAKMRQTLAADGLMILIGDSSQADIESIREIATAGWDPMEAIIEIKYPSIIIPQHSDAIIAHELALLIENFFAKPLPLQRLLEIFPSDETEALIQEWDKQGKVETVMIFESEEENLWPVQRSHIRCLDKNFRGDAYRIPWGCCSRQVYGIHDITALRDISRGSNHNRFIDSDRLFIDFYPKAVLRHPPNSLKVIELKEYALTEEDHKALGRRYIRLGDVFVKTESFDTGVSVDRRRLRVNTELLAERPFDRMLDPPFPKCSDEDITILKRLRLSLRNKDRERMPNLIDEEIIQAFQNIIARHLINPSIGASKTSPGIAISGGIWECTVKETIRDVVKTDRRLIEEPFLTQQTNIPQSEGTQRSFDCLGISLFIIKTDTYNDANLSERGDEPNLDSVLKKYATYLALARLIESFLKRNYLQFEKNFRTAVIPETMPNDIPSSYRILIYSLRSNEAGYGRSSISDQIFEPENLRKIMRWMHQRLETCDCENGCIKCCGGLGVIPENMLPRVGFSEQDAVSRKDIYILVCALLGYLPDWKQFYKRSKSFGGSKKAICIDTDDQLEKVTTEVIGTRAGEYKDGIWYKLFGGWMSVWEEMLARVRWMNEQEQGQNAISGLYCHNNEISVRPGYDEDTVKEILIHEFTHNWQYKSEKFDLSEHQDNPIARNYFDGKLVIEGHARWSEHQYRFDAGLGPIYQPGDINAWDEYKVGYFLMEGIEKAVGERGLFAWIQEGFHSKEPGIRSRNPKLQWPFDITGALKAFGLEQAARDGSFSSFDVVSEEIPEQKDTTEVETPEEQ